MIILEAAKHLVPKTWTKHLSDALYGSVPQPLHHSPLHLAATAHYLASPSRTTLATTNFDLLLELALKDAGVSPGFNVGELGPPHTPTVYHLHGVIELNQSWGSVVSFSDYASLTGNRHAWQRRFLSDSLKRGPLLLVGTSYRDPDIRHWLHQIFTGENPKYRVLVTTIREGLGLEPKLFAEIQPALGAYWPAIGLTPLPLHDLSAAAYLIRELPLLARPGYSSPRERTQHVWEAHRRRFISLQTEYNAALVADTRRVANAMKTHAQRGTLWLANGQGRLARWASANTQYLHPDDLKLVPCGHDSPWIAGKAISSEEISVKDIDKDQRAYPTWRSVVAIPIFATAPHYLPYVTAVLTFGLPVRAETVLKRAGDWHSTLRDISQDWQSRVSATAQNRY